MNMQTITIDHNRCTLCMNCTYVCPPQILHREDGRSDEGRIIIDKSERCVSCGHCAAVCPADAIRCHSDNKKNPFIIRSLPDDLPPERSLFYTKRSIRAYKDQPLEAETVKKLIHYGDLAPSGHNFRQRKYYVVTAPELINRLEDEVLSVYKPLTKILNPVLLGLIGVFSKSAKHELSDLKESFLNLFEERGAGKMPVFRNAPCIICIAAPTKSTSSSEDCTIAQTYMMLAGETMDVGSCIIGYAQYAHKKLEKLLNVPKDHSIYAVTVFGYPAIEYKKIIEYPNKPVIHM